MPEIGPFSRREFVATTGTAAVASFAGGVPRAGAAPAKARYAMVGTGHRGTSMWGAEVLAQHPDAVEFVGLCDINPLRLEAGRKLIGVTCPTFTDFDQMLATTKPDTLAVTTTDSEHHKFIIKGLERGIRVITEKPMTTDEVQCQAVIEVPAHMRVPSARAGALSCLTHRGEEERRGEATHPDRRPREVLV